MQNKKVTMLAAVLAVTIIAMAGVGYAAYAYTASTSNTNNAMDSTYLTVTQNGTGAYAEDFLSNLKFNSVNTTLNDTEYTPVYTGVLDETAKTYTATTEGANVALISVPLNLLITPTGNSATAVDMTVDVTKFTENTDLEYIMLISSTQTSMAYVAEYGAVSGHATQWYFESVKILADSPTTYSVQLFVKGATEDPTTGFPATKDAQGQATPDNDKSKFTFTIGVPQV
jgi:hypothetical protein